MKRVAAVTALVALMTASFVAVSSAHVRKVDSNITFHIDRNGADTGDSDVYGWVTSRRHGCEAFRHVELHRVTENGNDNVVASTTTNANGRYGGFFGPIPRGTYYTKAVRTVVNNNPGHHHVCRKAVSQEKVVVGGPLLLG